MVPLSKAPSPQNHTSVVVLLGDSSRWRCSPAEAPPQPLLRDVLFWTGAGSGPGLDPVLLSLQGHGLSPAVTRRLTGMRLCLAELSVAVLEERCAVEVHQAVERAKKTSVEIKLEEFTRSSPEQVRAPEQGSLSLCV